MKKETGMQRATRRNCRSDDSRIGARGGGGENKKDRSDSSPSRKTRIPSRIPGCVSRTFVRETHFKNICGFAQSHPLTGPGALEQREIRGNCPPRAEEVDVLGRSFEPASFPPARFTSL